MFITGGEELNVSLSEEPYPNDPAEEEDPDSQTPQEVQSPNRECASMPN